MTAKRACHRRRRQDRRRGRTLALQARHACDAGFGRTEEGGQQPKVLQEAEVPIVRDSVAAEAYPYLVDGVDPLFGGFENETQVAAGHKKGAPTPARARGSTPESALARLAVVRREKALRRVRLIKGVTALNVTTIGERRGRQLRLGSQRLRQPRGPRSGRSRFAELAF